MYDFCFTPFYAAVLALGGLAGYAAKGSLPSLGAGLGSGFVLLVLTMWSYKTFTGSRRKATLAVVGSLLVALGLTTMMGKRYATTGGGVPGAMAVVSALMSVYYCYNLACIPSVAPKPGRGHGGTPAEKPGAKRERKLNEA